MYVAVTAGTLSLGGRADTSPVIEFGEVTRPELNKMTADNLANGYIDLVTPNIKKHIKIFLNLILNCLKRLGITSLNKRMLLLAKLLTNFDLTLVKL